MGIFMFFCIKSSDTDLISRVQVLLLLPTRRTLTQKSNLLSALLSLIICSFIHLFIYLFI